ncbi:hypothetical protein L6164_035177 [Bauhinia variegata]|uniref:Uncharacterized protein n=1 Tax=Bauhinia variegata TaxID=167791 RepID=A0ACB9KWT3_BAUVA|nr:hypothetical protein L6164_035177 [Bauhinia variegata]
MATSGVSSTTKSHNMSTSITTALASALLEWLLIFFLFFDAALSYIITKFACYCKLQIPCLFCSRLDHVFGKEKQGYYWDLVCLGHKLEISSLILCRTHERLVNVHGMCESCLFSFATINKSNAETYRLLVGKFGEGSDSKFDEGPLLGGHKLSFSARKHCSCCNEQWVLKDHCQKLESTKSIESETAELDIPLSDAVGNSFHEKSRKRKPSVLIRATRVIDNQLDPLAHVGYTELKITSDTESEAHLSDDDATNTLVDETDYTKEDINVQFVQTEPLINDLDEDLTSERLKGSASPLEPLELESDKQLGYPNTHGSKSFETAQDLQELKSQQFGSSTVCPSPSEDISLGHVRPSSNKSKVPVHVSKEADDWTTDEMGLTSEQKSITECEEIIKLASKLTTSEAGLESIPVSSDINQQNPNLLDLGDAYKLAVGNRGRQLSGKLTEHWLGKDSSRISEDLKILLSQLSASRGTDQSTNEMSPRPSINNDEANFSDASIAAGMQILQRRISLERNESGLSLDGSVVSEIEGESMVDRLKRQVDHDRKLLSALYKELEEERNASAVAANQALAMITRLQEEKATLHMEALQYLRMMDEQSEYDMEALQKANDLVAEKEKEIQDLEAELAFYRKKFPDESMLESLEETSSDVKVKDIGLDQLQSHGNPSSSDKVEGPCTSLEGKYIGLVRSSLLELEDERLYILQRLKKLEKQVYHFLNIQQIPDNETAHQLCDSVNPYPESECQENSGKEHGDPLVEDSVSSLRSNPEPLVYKENSSPVLCKCTGTDLASVQSLVSDLNGRLQVLEVDQGFLEHTINILMCGEGGLELLKEIANHLRQLRRIGIRELDTEDA